MDAVNGVHLHRPIQGTFGLDLNGQRIDFTDIIFNDPYEFAFVYLVASECTNPKWYFETARSTFFTEQQQVAKIAVRF
jgi:hypothetical protein